MSLIFKGTKCWGKWTMGGSLRMIWGLIEFSEGKKGDNRIRYCMI
jgi:hypothetical protein